MPVRKWHYLLDVLCLAVIVASTLSILLRGTLQGWDCFTDVPVTPELEHGTISDAADHLQGAATPLMIIVSRHICISIY